VDVVLRDGQQDVDRGGVREEAVHREAQHEGRAVGCGGELIITVAVPCAGGGSLFQPFEGEGEAGKLLQLDGVGLDAQYSGGLRLGDVVAQTPIRQQNACDGELICDRLAQDGVELADVEEGLFCVDVHPGEGRRLDRAVRVELVEGQLQSAGGILAADAAAGGVHSVQDAQQRGRLGAVGGDLVAEREGCAALQGGDFAVELCEDHAHGDSRGEQHGQ